MSGTPDVRNTLDSARHKPSLMIRYISIIYGRYANMSEEDIMLDRYAKFRKLGDYEEFLVRGGQWRAARQARAEVRLNPDSGLQGFYQSGHQRIWLVYKALTPLSVKVVDKSDLFHRVAFGLMMDEAESLATFGTTLFSGCTDTEKLFSWAVPWSRSEIIE